MTTDRDRSSDSPTPHTGRRARTACRRIHAATLLVVFAGMCGCRPRPLATQEPDAAPPVAAASPTPIAPAASLAPDTVAPTGYLTARLFRVVETSQGDVVLLTDASEERFLPIFVGGTEALSIRLRHDKQRYPRPLTHDLLDTLVDKLGGRILKVQVDDIKNKVFVGRVFLAQGSNTFDVDARPSDAIALAVGSSVPIFVASAVFDAASVPARELGLDKNPDTLRVPPRARPDEPMQL